MEPFQEAPSVDAVVSNATAFAFQAMPFSEVAVDKDPALVPPLSDAKYMFRPDAQVTCLPITPLTTAIACVHVIPFVLYAIAAVPEPTATHWS
jgi:hypothetical protein